MTPSIRSPLILTSNGTSIAGFGPFGSSEKVFYARKIEGELQLEILSKFYPTLPCQYLQNLEVQRTGAGVNTKLSITAVIKIYKDLVKGKGLTRKQKPVRLIK